jgi:dTDP-4-dehydrorhamnose 3,5-epimerase-like enzyme
MVREQSHMVRKEYESSLDMFRDNRGILHSLKNLPFQPKEILVSQNSKNVFRGLHMSPYAKFIYVSRGEIRDVYWHDGVLTDTTLVCGSSLYIPANAAHGFFSTEESEVIYLLESEFDPLKDRNIYWRTPEFSIPHFDNAILSQKDKAAKYYETYDYLVLGSSGFLGQQCVKYLRSAGHKVLESSARLASLADRPSNGARRTKKRRTRPTTWMS